MQAGTRRPKQHRKSFSHHSNSNDRCSMSRTAGMSFWINQRICTFRVGFDGASGGAGTGSIGRCWRKWNGGSAGVGSGFRGLENRLDRFDIHMTDSFRESFFESGTAPVYAKWLFLAYSLRYFWARKNRRAKKSAAAGCEINSAIGHLSDCHKRRATSSK